MCVRVHACVCVCQRFAVPPGERVSGEQVSGVRVAGEEDKSILRQLVGQLSDEKRHLQAERDTLEAEVEQLKESAQVWWAVLEYYIWLRPAHLSCMRVFVFVRTALQVAGGGGGGGCVVPRRNSASLRGHVSRGVQTSRKSLEKRQLDYLRTKLGEGGGVAA